MPLPGGDMRDRVALSAIQKTLTASRGRLWAIGSIVFLVLVVLGVRLWQLQVVDGVRFRDMSEKNRVRLKRVHPPRGLMLDRAGRVVAENRPSFDVVFVPEDAADRQATLQNLAGYVPPAVWLLNGDSRERSPLEGLVVARDVAWETLATIEAHQFDLPGVTISARLKRFYSDAAFTAAHLLGYVGEISPTELADSGEYRRGDIVGKRGLEKSWEPLLRGRAGAQQVEVDAAGRELRLMGEVKAQPGHDVSLTLDLHLQQRAEQAMGDVEGALVVLDVRTGAVLASVSRPTFDPNLFSRGILPDQWNALLDNPLKPLTNRVLQGGYPPGSTLKPMMALAALEAGVVTPDTRVYCSGGLKAGGRTFGCWRRRGHGRLDLTQAIVQSCDVYFYRLGERLGIDTAAEYARRFWLGRDLGLSLEAVRGLFPDPEWKRRRFNEPWYRGETFNVAIGQGSVVTTPLHMAVATAAIANGGVVYRPAFVQHAIDQDGIVVHRQAPEELTRLNVAETNLSIVRNAMREVVNGVRGTGRAARLPDIEVAGKTGTAQVVGGVLDQNESVPRHHRDHAWFIAYAPADRPEIAVACLIEHAGKGGGSVAAPVVRQVLEAYFEKSRPQGERHAGIRPTAD